VLLRHQQAEQKSAIFQFSLSPDSSQLCRNKVATGIKVRAVEKNKTSTGIEKAGNTF
jgi:hypothetical protein